DVRGQAATIRAAGEMARKQGIKLSLFVAPDIADIEASSDAGAQQVELHTGEYCHACEAGSAAERTRELKRLAQATSRARALNLEVAAGHGLTRHNVGRVVAIDGVEEVNIGHSVIADAVLFGLDRAVRDLKEAIARGVALRPRT